MSEPCRLLVVDDDVNIREMLDMVLVSEGYEVIVAAHGAAALGLLDEVRPHVILLDMKMPVMDGWEFLRRYRHRPGEKVPVVVLTAAQDDKCRAADVGADAYVAKPFAIDDLIRVLDQYTSPDLCVRRAQSWRGQESWRRV
jgi:two-component system, chemotaxis family, chemotaxis protein CheY